MQQHFGLKTLMTAMVAEQKAEDFSVNARVAVFGLAP
jgi:hypothetical protein